MLQRLVTLSVPLRRWFWPLLFLISAFGFAGGIGVFTFAYAKGSSYFRDDPRACDNCHVMNAVYEAWMKGGHQHVAVCNDCHVPHDFFGKWFVKADNGFHHSYAFTFLKIPPVIRAREGSQHVVQENCVRCHGGLAEHVIGGPSGSEEALRCVSCHREAGHHHGG